MKETRSRPLVSLIVCAILLGVPALYVIGYFALGTDATAFVGPRQFRVRVYRDQWQATLFRPLAIVEAAIVGEEVETAY
jgi:hypothetical protein